ncbi:MAG: glycosyltransferase family 4 protein [Mangrovicoccus sp.]
MKAVFAIPGDIATKTGGYIYERSLLWALRDLGWAVEHLELPAGFPHPSAAEMADSAALLRAVPADCPIIIDGLVFGSLDSEILQNLAAPFVAMTHHPLGYETGLSAEMAQALIRREKTNLGLALQVVVPSPHTYEVLRDDFAVDPARMQIALPGVTRPSGAPCPVDPPLILSVGILAERKGHDVLLKALSQITDLRWQAAIVGKSHDKNLPARLTDLAVKLGVAERVRFTGLINDTALVKLYHQASLFALATRYEGYGMAFAEALTHGLPIVTCRAGAVPQTVPETAGQLVPVDDDRQFAAALRLILTDATARDSLAQGARAAGEALPSWRDTAQIMARAVMAAKEGSSFS